MKFVKKLRVNAPAGKVWKVFAHDFDRAYEWMASVPNSYGKANGKLFEGAKSAGRVCELNSDPKGLKAFEQFLDYDESKKTCTVRIDFVNTPIVFPVDHNAVRFSVVDIGENQSELTWAFGSQIKPWAFVIWPFIRIGFGVFIGQIAEELKYFVEHDAPHPRKVRAINKMATVSRA